MKKLSLYLDTSVWNFYFAEDAPIGMLQTKRFFDEIKQGKFEIFISTIVIDEVMDTLEPKRMKLLNLIKSVSLSILEVNIEVKTLADKYIQNKIIPLKYEDDALHISLAVVNKIDVIISWNFQHMVNVRKNREINGINLIEGYKEIEIRTPQEVSELE